MPKIKVTNELASVIRNLRLENKVTAKALSEHIGMSQSYISKFEKGNISTIKKELLDEIVNFIISNRSVYLDRIDEILKTASFYYTTKELERQLWFENFSMVFSAIPIPKGLVDDINSKMQEHSITRETLRNRINSNEFILDENGNPHPDNDKYPRNEWFQREGSNGNEHEIIMDISIEKINSILDSKQTKTRFVFLLAIVLYLLKMIKFKECVVIPIEDKAQLCDEAYQYLYGYNFYPLSEKYRRLQSSQQLSIQDQSNQEEIAKVTGFFHVWSDYDVQHANNVLSTFSKNLTWDSAFMEKIISLPFNEIAEASYTFKKKLLDEIAQQVSVAIDTPEKEKSLEQYD
jgi:transcriptional regulator with XRE-family HTH domain